MSFSAVAILIAALPTSYAGLWTSSRSSHVELNLRRNGTFESSDVWLGSQSKPVRPTYTRGRWHQEPKFVVLEISEELSNNSISRWKAPKFRMKPLEAGADTIIWIDLFGQRTPLKKSNHAPDPVDWVDLERADALAKARSAKAVREYNQHLKTLKKTVNPFKGKRWM